MKFQCCKQSRGCEQEQVKWQCGMLYFVRVVEVHDLRPSFYTPAKGPNGQMPRDSSRPCRIDRPIRPAHDLGVIHPSEKAKAEGKAPSTRFLARPSSSRPHTSVIPPSVPAAPPPPPLTSLHSRRPPRFRSRFRSEASPSFPAGARTDQAAMADAYWRYAAADPRQQQQPPAPSAAAGAGAHPGMGGAPQMAPAGGQQPMKRPRPADFSGSPARPAPPCPAI